jgi:hypothetical protein
VPICVYLWLKIMQEAHTLLVPWESFYVIVGSSGAALTGLQFVVIALTTESTKRSTGREVAAFGTPTVMHFCAVLLMAAILSAPWHDLSSVALALGACGLAGVLYCGITFRRALRTIEYKPVLSDWIWHSVMPLIAYASVMVSAILLQRAPQRALFLAAAAALLLLFIGIHNAWDTATYLAMHVLPKERKKR